MTEQFESLSQIPNTSNCPKTINKKTTVILAIVFILIVFGILMWEIQKSIMPPLSLHHDSTSTESITLPIITQMPEDKLPENFPTYFPLNEKIKILQSYSAIYSDSAIKQATVIFESSKTMNQNYDFYTKLAQDNDWQIINKLDRENLKNLYLRNKKEDINITIIPAKDKTKSEVNISYVKF